MEDVMKTELFCVYVAFHHWKRGSRSQESSLFLNSRWRLLSRQCVKAVPRIVPPHILCVFKMWCYAACSYYVPFHSRHSQTISSIHAFSNVPSVCN